MKRFLVPAVFSAVILMFPAFLHCEEPSCPEDPDNIVGVYFVSHEGEESRVRIFRQPDDTYSAQVLWIKDSLDRDGNLRLDARNPDKSLRNVPCNRIIIMKGLKYDSEKGRWSGKVYDPTRGIRANATCSFDPDGRLRVRGSLLGISETVWWKKLE